MDFLNSDLSKLRGIGEKKLKLYDKLLLNGDSTVESCGPRFVDLLFHLPERLQQRKFVKSIAEINQSDVIIAKVEVLNHDKPVRKKQPYRILCSLGDSFITLLFYNYYEQYITSKLAINSNVFVSGRVDINGAQVRLIHPDYVVSDGEQVEIPKLEPIYSLTAGLTNRELIKTIDFVVKNIPNFPEWIEGDFLKFHSWSSWKDSMLALHKPAVFLDPKDNPYVRRLAFDELLAQQLSLALVRIRGSDVAKIPLDKTKITLKNKLVNELLSFELTEWQKKAIEEIENDVFSPKKMVRLLQGDVGSGKTIVSLVIMLSYIENRHQCALIVPTSLLAHQHFEKISNLGQQLGINVTLLTGKIRGKQRQKILDSLISGDIDLLIGTHALLEEAVKFKNLGLVVIDEQHRFGVKQRLALINKGNESDILALSATPIPRSLALTLYGGLAITTLEGKPSKRCEIGTSLLNIKTKYEELLKKIENKLNEHEKVYWVCPLVEEMEGNELSSVMDKYAEFCEFFGKDRVGFVHGKMKENEKDRIMEEFLKTDDGRILIATTVIEVGIDVPEATLMVVEHPERFGLSQLHQLRGRVGRGNLQSHCLLLYDEVNCSKNTLRRLNILRSTSNGFAIAEEDLKIRGIGEILGLKQSGQQHYRVADLDRDFDLLKQAAQQVSGIMIKLKNEHVNFVRSSPQSSSSSLWNSDVLKKYLPLLNLFDYGKYLGDILN